ncbi:hypothetical protein [Flavobacterium sp. WC2430]|uniref:hypothetical protein n=1 Tax=Flavobacterium sp. WC2430 TaxID=3234137 RepID=UPI0034655514
MFSKKNRIEEIKKNGYTLSFESVFNLAFKNYKKIVLYAGLMFFVFAVIMAVFVSAILIYKFGANQLTEILKPENLNPDHLTGNSRILFLVGSIVFSVLLSPFMAGFIKMAYCAERDEEFHVSTIFEYYNSSYFKELVIATLLISIVNTGLPVLLDQPELEIVMNLVSYAILFLTFLTIPLILFSDLKAIDAIKTSVIIFFKKPFLLLGLILVGYIVSVIGFLVFYIGIFFTLPFLYSMYYAIYSEIIGFETEEKTESNPF